jgi:hypothetical protein
MFWLEGPGCDEVHRVFLHLRPVNLAGQEMTFRSIAGRQKAGQKFSSQANRQSTQKG